MSKELAQQQTEWDLHENPETFIPLEFTEEIKPDLFGLELSKANEMVSGLSTTLAEREVLKNAYIDVIALEITSENLPIFKELRLKIVKNRTQGIEKWHKTNKAFYLAGGRFVDAVKNKEVAVNEDMESKLMDAEKYFENLEKEILNILRIERENLIKDFVDVIPNDLENLDQDVFDSFLETKKKYHAEKIENERLEAEKIEKERIAKEKEIEAQRLENLRLKAEAEAKEKALIEERKIQAEKEAKIKDEKNKLEAELKAKKDEQDRKDAEELAKLKIEAKEREKLAKSPIKKQLSVWVESFEIPNISVDNETSKEIIQKFEAFKKWSFNQINNL